LNRAKLSLLFSIHIVTKNSLYYFKTELNVKEAVVCCVILGKKEMVNQMNVLDVSGIYVSIDQKPILQDINFSIAQGEMLALVGHNGAGKSTLMKTLMGMFQKKSGDMTLQGKYTLDHDLLAYKKNLSYLPEEPLLLPELTVQQHFQLYAMSYEIEETVFEERCAEFVQALELEHKLHVFPEELSKGMRQKVQAICTLLPDVHLLLIDEHFMGLDVYAIDYVNYILRYKIKQGTGILLTTHQLEQVKEIADTYILLEQGKIKEKGPVGMFQSISRGTFDV